MIKISRVDAIERLYACWNEVWRVKRTLKKRMYVIWCAGCANKRIAKLLSVTIGMWHVVNKILDWMNYINLQYYAQELHKLLCLRCTCNEKE